MYLKKKGKTLLYPILYYLMCALIHYISPGNKSSFMSCQLHIKSRQYEISRADDA